MNERILIGQVCEKGNHAALVGEDDYGVCGSHYYADIYVTVERKTQEDGTPYYGRGQSPNLSNIAADIRDRVATADAYSWMNNQ